MAYVHHIYTRNALQAAGYDDIVEILEHAEKDLKQVSLQTMVC